MLSKAWQGVKASPNTQGSLAARTHQLEHNKVARLCNLLQGEEEVAEAMGSTHNKQVWHALPARLSPRFK